MTPPPLVPVVARSFVGLAQSHLSGNSFRNQASFQKKVAAEIRGLLQRNVACSIGFLALPVPDGTLNALATVSQGATRSVVPSSSSIEGAPSLAVTNQGSRVPGFARLAYGRRAVAAAGGRGARWPACKL